MAITGRGRYYLAASLTINMLAAIVFLTTKRINVTELEIFPEILGEDETKGIHNEQGDILYDARVTISLSSEITTNQDYPRTKNVKKEAGNCREVQFSKSKLPLTYLSSLPGSGNTWVRHLLQQATGKYNQQSPSSSIIGTVNNINM